MRRAFALLLLLLALVVPAAAQTSCHTVTLPNSDGTGGAFTQPVGVTYPIVYGPVSVATGVEFWFHQHWAGAAPWTLQYLIYINGPGDVGRRIFWTANGADEAQTGKAVSFPMSTFINPGETLVVASVNNAGQPAPGYLIVTLRVCS